MGVIQSRSLIVVGPRHPQVSACHRMQQSCSEMYDTNGENGCQNTFGIHHFHCFSFTLTLLLFLVFVAQLITCPQKLLSLLTTLQLMKTLGFHFVSWSTQLVFVLSRDYSLTGEYLCFKVCVPTTGLMLDFGMWEPKD